MDTRRDERLIRALDALPFPEGGMIMAAVSGGADSMALLHALIGHCRERGVALHAAHVEHGIRGAASLADAKRVTEYCDSMGISLSIAHADVPALAEKRCVGLETAAREARYALLSMLLEKSGASYCVLAHHRGDQAETFLNNLVRGSGARGLAGMRPVQGWLYRPWLNFSASDLRAYAEAYGLPFADDATNAVPDNPRNIMRHEVLPILAHLNPSVEEAIARAAAALAEDDDALSKMAQFAVKKRLSQAGFYARGWDDPPAVRKRALAFVLRTWGGHPEAHHLNGLDAWLMERGAPPRHMDIPGLRVLARRGVLTKIEV